MTLTDDPVVEMDIAVAELPEPISSKRRGLLLVVDDEDGPRQSLRVIFKDDYDLLMAEDGPTAIELAQKHPVDVAVLDIRMAGMSARASQAPSPIAGRRGIGDDDAREPR